MPITIPQPINSLGISANNGRKSSTTTTGSNDSTYHGTIHSNIASIQTAPTLYSSQQGDVTLTDEMLEEAGHPDFEDSNDNVGEKFAACASPGKKLRKFLDRSSTSSISIALSTIYSADFKESKSHLIS